MVPVAPKNRMFLGLKPAIMARKFC
jgi:hypothetical protein